MGSLLSGWHEAGPVVPISALEHHVYCARQCALIHVDGVWLDNLHTVRGHHGHKRADSGEIRSERGKTVIRSVPLFSERLGLTGRADAIEIGPEGGVVPIEYKMGFRHGMAADVQVCAQALCLEEMTGQSVPEGRIWLSGTRKRLPVTFDVELRTLTLRLVDEIRTWMRSPTLPPAENDQRCGQCQFLDMCLPDLVAEPVRVQRYLDLEVLACGS